MVIDPTISLTTPAESDCTMLSGHPSILCNTGSYAVVGDKSDGYDTRRSLAQFVTTSLPGNAKVTQANWAFYTNYLTGTSSEKLDIYENGQSWNNTADWTDATTNPSTAAWPGSGGGDQTDDQHNTGSSANVVFSTTMTPADTGWNYAPITRLAQEWLDGSEGNHGMLIRADSESSSTGLYSYDDSWSASNQSYLDLFYTARDGDDGIQTYTSTPLTDQTNLKVDPASGNVLLETTDMHVAGTGNQGDLTFKHYYNSFSAWQAHLAGTVATPSSQLGTGWTTDNSLDSTVTLYDYDDGGSATVEMPGGVPQVFTKTSASGSFNAPDGMHADLTHDDSAHTTKLVDHMSGLTYRWSGSGGSSPTSTDIEHLTSITTPPGDTLSFANPSGSEETVSDTKGRVFEEQDGPAYGGGPTVLQSISDDHASRSVSFGYNSSGQLTSYTDATGAVTDYGYDTNGMLNDISNPTTGRDTQLIYYTSGAFAGKVETITRSSTTDCASNSQTHVTRYSYNGNIGNAGPKDQNGNYTADAATNVVDALNHTTIYYWDNQRRVLETDDPAGHKQDNTYDSTTGQLATFTDNVSSQVTSLQYDTSSGLVSQVTSPKTDMHARTAAKVDSRTDDNASDSGYQGPAKLPTETTDAEGAHTYYTIPAQGNPYGGKDEVTKVSKNISGSSNITQQLSYNSNGTVATISNSDGNTTTYSYDGNANLQTVTPPSPMGATSYTEDADNRTRTKTDADGHTTTYSYDGDDRVTRVDFSDGTYITYTYDTDGNQTQRRNRNGSLDTVSYDALNRPTAESFNGESESFCYNAVNRLTSLTDAGGTVTYSYDGSSEMLKSIAEPGTTSCSNFGVTGTSLPAANSGCITITENGDNQPTAIGYPGGVLRTTKYLQDGKTKEIQVTKGSTTDEDLQFSYDSDGCSATPANGGTSSDTSSEDDQLQCTVDTTTSSNVDTTYNYDTPHRLTGATNVETNTSGGNQNESWTYDTEGNITHSKTGSADTYFGYNNADELCWSGTTNGSGCNTPSGDSSYTLDGDGNTTAASNGFAASYDAADTAASINNIDTGGSTVTAGYADYGQTDRTTLGGMAFTNSILGLAASGTGPGGQRIDYTRLPTGQLLSMRVGTIPAGGMGSYNPATSINSYYSMVDQQGSVLGLTDASGSIDAQYRYDPYGQLLTHTGSVNVTNRMRWLGAEYDYNTSTGSADDLYHLGARYYSPTAGRFITPDPKTHQLDVTQQNTYGYGRSTPTNNTDSIGFGAASGCAAGAGTGAAFGVAGPDETIVGGIVAVGAGCAIGALGSSLSDSTDEGADGDFASTLFDPVYDLVDDL